MKEQLDDGIAQLTRHVAENGMACFAFLLVDDAGGTFVTTDSDGWDRLKLMGLMDVLKQRTLEQLSYHYLEELDDDEE